MKDTKAILTKLCPTIDKVLEKNKNGYKNLVASFIRARHEQLYDSCPCDRIFFRADDEMAIFKFLGLDEGTIKMAISETYYAPMANFNPRAAKGTATVVLLSILRHFVVKKDENNIKLALIHLIFSGQFYPSMHYSSFPTVCPSRSVMEYVVNVELSNKFELKKQGSVIGAMVSLGQTCVESYRNRFAKFHDEDVVYIIQQIITRIKSSLQHVASIFYEVNKNGTYMNYNSDSFDQEDYHLSTSDTQKAEAAVARASDYLANSEADYGRCKMCSDTLVRTEELKSIIDTILTDVPVLEIKTMIRYIVYAYYSAENTKKDILDLDFIAYSIKAKPNSKDKNVMEQKALMEKWLNESSAAYRKRKSRETTRLAYHKAVTKYFVLSIRQANIG